MRIVYRPLRAITLGNADKGILRLAKEPGSYLCTSDRRPPPTMLASTQDKQRLVSPSATERCTRKRPILLNNARAVLGMRVMRAAALGQAALRRVNSLIYLFEGTCYLLPKERSG